MKKNQKFFFLFLILLLAAFFRLWNLQTIPPGLYPDEAINGVEAFLSPGKIFYPENNGREGLFINLISLFFKIFGPSAFSIRLVSACFGILTVFGLYLLGKELFYQFSENEREKISLLASFFLAVSFWHTNFSRIGFRGILLPFALVFWLYFLLSGLRIKSAWRIIVSGIIFGLGFYTYSSFRLGFLLFLAIWIYLWFSEGKKNLKRFMVLTLEFVLPAFIILLPLGIYFLLHPADFFGRLGPISIFAQSNPIFAFRESLIRHLLMFNFSGDKNWRHNISGSPQLFWPVGILFLIGFVFVLNKFTLACQKKNFSDLFNFGLLLFCFFIFLLPGVLTYEGLPHSLRTIGTIPAVYLFSSLGAFWMLNFLKKVTLKYKFLCLLLKLICIFFILFITFNQMNRYFIIWAKNENVKGAFTENFVQMGKYVASFSPEIKKYVIVNEPGVPVLWLGGIPMPAQTLIFQEISQYKKIRAIYLKPEDFDKIELEKKLVVLLMKEDNEILKKLKEKYPQGEIKKDFPLISFEIF
jgi:4-amino-4-deoxy-L-arabinose transferase-like glycosyltransferase